MKQFEFEEMDKMAVISLIAEGLDTYDIITKYKITEDVIFACWEFFDKEIILQGCDFSQDMIKTLLESNYLEKEDIKDLSVRTYINFSADFISEYKDDIKWDRMIMYIATQSDLFDEYVDIIKQYDLWSYISANDLSIDFIRKWKDKLDWRYVSMVKNFTDEEKEEFSKYIIVNESEPVMNIIIDRPEIKIDEDLIENISKHYESANWKFDDDDNITNL